MRMSPAAACGEYIWISMRRENKRISGSTARKRSRANATDAANTISNGHRQLMPVRVWFALTTSSSGRAARPGQLSERLTHDLHQIQGHR